MGIVKEVLDLGPKSAEVIEAWLVDPAEAMRRPVAVSEGFTLVIAALFVSGFTFIVTGLVWFATFFPETLRRQAGGNVDEKLSALFTLAGVQLLIGFCSIALVGLIVTVVARISGSGPRTGLFAKVIAVFSLEALSGIPMAVLVFCEDEALEIWMLIALGVLRLTEIGLVVVPLRVAGGLRGFRLAMAWGIGVPLPTAALVYVLSIMNWVLLAPSLVKGWD